MCKVQGDRDPVERPVWWASAACLVWEAVSSEAQGLQLGGDGRHAAGVLGVVGPGVLQSGRHRHRHRHDPPHPPLAAALPRVARTWWALPDECRRHPIPLPAAGTAAFFSPSTSAAAPRESHLGEPGPRTHARSPTRPTMAAPCGPAQEAPLWRWSASALPARQGGGGLYLRSTLCCTWWAGQGRRWELGHVGPHGRI